MPVDVVLEPESGIISYTARGDVTLAEIVGALRQVYEAPDYQTPSLTLFDLTSATPVLTSDQVRAVADFVQKHRPPGPGRAAIVASSDFTYGLGRMYEILVEEFAVDTHVFRDLAEARQWLLA